MESSSVSMDSEDSSISKEGKLQYFLLDVYLKKLHTDIEIIVPEDGTTRKVLNAHGLVLASVSPVFADMIYLHHQDRITVSQLSYETAREMITFVYTQRLPDNVNFSEMCRASQLYSLNCLRKACSEKIEQQLKTADAPSIKNAFGNLESALYLRDDALKDRCLAFIKTNFTEVMSLEALSGSQPEAVICFLRYLAKEEHDIKPGQLLRFVIPWLETRKEQEFRNIILSHIDVMSMSEEEFHQILRERPLLFNQEEIGKFILNKLNSPSRNSTTSHFKKYYKSLTIFFSIFLAIVIIYILFITRTFVVNLKFLVLSFTILAIYLLILRKLKSSLRHRKRILTTFLMFISFSFLLHIPMNDLDNSTNNQTIRNSSPTCEKQLLEFLLKFQNVTSTSFNSSENSQNQSTKLNTTAAQLYCLKKNTPFLEVFFYFIGVHTVSINIVIFVYALYLRNENKIVRFASKKCKDFEDHFDTILIFIIIAYFCLRPFFFSLILYTINLILVIITWFIKYNKYLDKILKIDFFLILAYDIFKSSLMYFYNYLCLLNMISCLILTLIIYFYFCYFNILNNIPIKIERLWILYLTIVHILNFVYYLYQNQI